MNILSHHDIDGKIKISWKTFKFLFLLWGPEIHTEDSIFLNTHVLGLDIIHKKSSYLSELIQVLKE